MRVTSANATERCSAATRNWQPEHGRLAGRASACPGAADPARSSRRPADSRSRSDPGGDDARGPGRDDRRASQRALGSSDRTVPVPALIGGPRQIASYEAPLLLAEAGHAAGVARVPDLPPGIDPGRGNVAGVSATREREGGRCRSASGLLTRSEASSAPRSRRPKRASRRTRNSPRREAAVAREWLCRPRGGVLVGDDVTGSAPRTIHAHPGRNRRPRRPGRDEPPAPEVDLEGPGGSSGETSRPSVRSGRGSSWPCRPRAAVQLHESRTPSRRPACARRRRRSSIGQPPRRTTGRQALVERDQGLDQAVPTGDQGRITEAGAPRAREAGFHGGADCRDRGRSRACGGDDGRGGRESSASAMSTPEPDLSYHLRELRADLRSVQAALERSQARACPRPTWCGRGSASSRRSTTTSTCTFPER